MVGFADGSCSCPANSAEAGSSILDSVEGMSTKECLLPK